DFWLVRQFAAASTWPIASSLVNEVSRRRWIESDFTPFQAAGHAGLDFAYFAGFARNHTARDDPAHLDVRSLQHQGSSALALARRFGGLDLTDVHRGEGDAVFFDPFGGWLVVYPMRAVPFIVLACAALLVCVLVLGVRRRRLTAGGVASGLGLIALTLVATVGLVSLVWVMLRSAYDAQGLPDVGSASDGLHEMGLVCLAAAVATAVFAIALKNVKVAEMAVAGHVVWLAFAVATALWAPGASYLFAWPLMASLIALLVVLLLRDDPLTSIRAFVLAGLGALPGILLLSAATYLFLMTAGSRPLGPAIAIWLLLALLPVQLELIFRVTRRLVPGLLLIAGLAMFVFGGATATFDRAHPRENSVFYQLQAGSGEARWLSLDDQADLWSSQFLSAAPRPSTNVAYFPRVGKADYLFATAPRLALPGPRLQVLNDVIAEGKRTLTMRVTSPRGAPVLSIMAESVVGTLAAKVDGVALGSANTHVLDGTSVRWAADYYALPREGIVLTMSYDEPQKALRIRLMDCSYGLPAAFASYYRARPDFMIPGDIGDATLVAMTYDLPSPIAPPKPASATAGRKPSPGPSPPGSPSPIGSVSPTPAPTASELWLRPAPVMPARPVLVPGVR
ncbi:MAG: M28 family peptidase, partial [Thermoleophilia bacterium]